jgi:Pregnancy-associated plasma protein-A/Secretion system C-terminal sorting domain
MMLRKLKLLISVIYLSLYIALPVTAQQKKAAPLQPTLQRCQTTEYLDELMRRDPTLKARMEADQERLNTATIKRIQEYKLNHSNNRLTAIVTIPVVIHIVLPDPTIVTDADVAWQINKLNEDFGGQNADSIKAGPFAALFGHSQIRFCLAQQDEKGNSTNAIERIVSTTTFTRFTPAVLKNKNTCGLKSWDVNRYFNIWVGNATDGTLGIATFPNSGPVPEQGIAISFQGFGNNGAYTNPAYNLGRTVVHETGHFFYARHIWGDGNCAADFPSVGGLPAFIDDTPPQSGSTIGCPNGTVATGCGGGPNPPGRMYQNYMDYTDDACYCMFTLNQVARMEAALDVFRTSLKTSNACSPPLIVANDAALDNIITPHAEESCVLSGNNTFCTPDFVPRVRIKNYGSSHLTSVTIYAQVDNLAPVATNWNGNLAQSGTAITDLNILTASGGSHILTVYVANPNGSADGKNRNDTLTTTFTIISGTPFSDPISEGFESATFPPGEWKVINPNINTTTWVKTTSAAKSGNASATLPFFNYADTGQVDYLLSPMLDVAFADSVVLNFQRAYKVFDFSGDFTDTLTVVVSTDCGNTYTEVWKRTGSGLATVAGNLSSTGYTPAAADWQNTRLNLKPFIGNAGQVIVGFKTVNGFGQNLYLDDINLEVFHYRTNDAAITALSRPYNRLCERTFIPAAELTNKGKDTIKTAKIVFVVDNTPVDSITFNGSLATGASVTVEGSKNITMPAGSQHSFTVYSENPNGTPDDNTNGDTIKIAVIVNNPQPPPIQEGFESPVFPPAEWSVTSSGSAYTWERVTTAASEKTASVRIRNFRFNSQKKKDDLYSSLVQTGVFDSVYLRFDVAHVPNLSTINGTPMDTLEVLLTSDCGKTFTSVYKKWGVALQTVTPAPANVDTNGFAPSNAAQWRKEFIDITPFISRNSKFQVVFRNTSNKGNNIYLDNININSVLLPARLKVNGYIIMPNPFNGSFLVRHVVPPTGLKSIAVYNSTGQIVHLQFFRGNASTYQYINLSRQSNGVYVVKLIYDTRVITERLIKL